jgi:hypothetical protein
MHKKPLGFGCIHRYKIFFCFFKEEINVKFFEFSFFFLRKDLEKNMYFSIGSESYNVNIQLNIM